MSDTESKNKRVEKSNFSQKEQKTIYNVKEKDIQKFQEYLKKQEKK